MRDNVGDHSEVPWTFSALYLKRYVAAISIESVTVWVKPV